ncbi:MAG: DUF2177 family protein [Desulfobacterales bacterium]
MVLALKIYAAMLVVFFAVDMLWLGWVARGFYRKHLGHWLAAEPHWPAAVLFYLLFILGVLVFVVLPGLASGSLGRTLALGALFGLVTYATYDLTNLATARDWPLVVTLVDMAWGTVLSTLVAAAGFLAGRIFG